MPITEQQAIEWAGSATADERTALRSPRPNGRLTADIALRRDQRKRATLDGPQSMVTDLGHRNAAHDPAFLSTFGHMDGISANNRVVPFLRLMFDPDVSAMMHRYIEEALQWMMRGGTARNNFQPLLWVGLRDWNTSSAWTRGVVLLYARRSCKKRTIATSKCNSIK
ncbi:hypothetical protein BCR35DRAFT_336152 [Leucosporidium creatinivorum]|uniref:Uncharacterized protein n=1 Tax=Leucosporidium creatinivorum TaxID=106004 RepID=A0A1Y2CKM4_9BASI|nr:hypothetical protein BCR35DRAFT_336152 [Leucosporidium creatinivorum]